MCEARTSRWSDRGVDVFQQKHGAALALQQGQRSLHDLPHNLLQVGLFLKQVVDHLQQRLCDHEALVTPRLLLSWKRADAASYPTPLVLFARL